jgi:hypothetical protein
MDNYNRSGKTPKTAFLLGISLCCTNFMYSQIAGFGEAEIKATGTFSGESDIEGSGASFSTRQWDISTPFFYNKGENLLLAGTFGYTLTDIDFSDSLLDQEDELLHEYKVSLLAMLDMSEKWKGLLVLAPSLASDMEDIDSDGLSYFALIAALYQVNPRFGVVFGAFQSTGYDEDRVLPAIGLRWTPSESMELVFAGPQASLRYKPTPSSTYSIFTGIEGTRWNTISGVTERNLRLRSFLAGLGYERKITGNFHFSLDVGAQFLREIEIKDPTGGLLLDKDVKEKPFIRTGLSYRF